MGPATASMKWLMAFLNFVGRTSFLSITILIGLVVVALQIMTHMRNELSTNVCVSNSGRLSCMYSNVCIEDETIKFYVGPQLLPKTADSKLNFLPAMVEGFRSECPACPNLIFDEASNSYKCEQWVKGCVNPRIQVVPESPPRAGSHWISEPTVLYMPYAASNAGHAILDNGIPVLYLLDLFGVNVSSARFVAMGVCENIWDWHTHGWPYDVEKCNKFMHNYLYSLSKHITPMDFKKMPQPRTCFRQLLGGLARTSMLNNYRLNNGSLFKPYRDAVLRHHGLQTQPICATVNIVFVVKKNRRTFANPGEMIDIMRSIKSVHNVAIKVTIMDHQALTIRESLRVLAQTDGLISPGGANLISSVFLPDDAVVLGMAVWDQQKKIEEKELNILRSVPYFLMLHIPIVSDDVYLRENDTDFIDSHATIPRRLFESKYNELLEAVWRRKYIYGGCAEFDALQSPQQ